MRAKGVRFFREPATRALVEIVPGVRSARESRRHQNDTVAVFEDLYGNLWALVQVSGDPTPARPS